MARTLTSLIAISLILQSCSSIKPLGTPPKSPVDMSATDATEDLNSEARVEEPEKIAAAPKERSLTKVILGVFGSEKESEDQPVSQEELEKAEEEIVQKYERSELLEEDPVHSVADSEPPFTLDYKKKHYDFWIKYFTERDSERFGRHVNNGMKFKKIVEQVFEEEGLPKDLFYVGLIESGYNTHIRSRASAVGPWQFIKGTATRYGLRVDSQLDERRNIFKATRAAASYFKDLYNIFGSWELALCAYNAGEYRIINAIRRGNTRDYKELVAKKLLPRETIYYIPKVAVAKKLVTTRYSKVKKPQIAKAYEEAVEVEVDKSFSLRKISKALGVSLKELKLLNPDVKRDWVRSRRRDHSLYVPKRVAKIAEAKIKKLPIAARSRRVASSTKVHKVRRGESLYRIARRYKTSISKLKSWNNLRRNKIFIGQKLKVRVPSSGDTYVVLRGDNLSTIARRYGISVRELKKLNRLRSSRIYVGQKLTISGATHKVYKVRRGDSLYRIARKFGVTIKTIVQANSLKGKTIYPNQEIILPI